MKIADNQQRCTSTAFISRQLETNADVRIHCERRYRLQAAQVRHLPQQGQCYPCRCGCCSLWGRARSERLLRQLLSATCDLCEADCALRTAALVPLRREWGENNLYQHVRMLFGGVPCALWQAAHDSPDQLRSETRTRGPLSIGREGTCVLCATADRRSLDLQEWLTHVQVAKSCPANSLQPGSALQSTAHTAVHSAHIHGCSACRGDPCLLLSADQLISVVLSFASPALSRCVPGVTLDLDAKLCRYRLHHLDQQGRSLTPRGASLPALKASNTVLIQTASATQRFRPDEHT
jgi:hypothetical protein